jgi:hypothetical protein
MTKDQVEQFLKLQPKLKITHDEMSVLSKKSPNDAVNKFKLKFLNNMLGSANELLADGYLPFDDFTQFSEDDIPTNSDVVFIFAPYLSALERLRSDNVHDQGYGSYVWLVDGKPDSSFKTTRPSTP